MTTALDVYNALNPSSAPQSGQSGASIAGGSAAAALAQVLGSGVSSGLASFAPVMAPAPQVNHLTFIRGWKPAMMGNGLNGIR